MRPRFDDRPIPDVGSPEATDGNGKAGLLSELMNALAREPQSSRDIGLEHELEIAALSIDPHGGEFTQGKSGVRMPVPIQRGRDVLCALEGRHRG